MKTNSIKYLVGQGLKGVWRNRMMSFASFCIMLVSLLMVGMSILTAMNLNRIIGGIEERNEVIVQISDDVEGEDKDDMVENLKNQIDELPNILEVSLYTKEEAWENMMSEMSKEEQELFQYADDNPLPDVFRVKIENIEKMDETTAQIGTFENVENIKSPTSFANILINMKRILGVISTIVVFALIVVCLVIISNTTRTSVFARRKEINIMKYVGARNSFIRVPFFVEGMVVGIFAAFGALALTEFAYKGIYNIFNDDLKLWMILGADHLYKFENLFIPVMVIYVISGALIGAVGTSLSTGKHLKV